MDARIRRLRARLSRFLDAGLDAAHTDPDVVRQVRTLQLAWFVLLTLTPTYAVVNWLYWSRAYGVLLGLQSVVSLVTLLALRRFHCVRTAAQIGTAMFFSAIAFCAAVGQGFRDPSITWLPLIPLANAFWVGHASALVWAGICAAMLTGLWTAEQLGVQLTSELAPSIEGPYLLLGQLLALPTVWGLVGIYAREQRRLEARLRRSHEQVRELALYDPLTRLPNRRCFAERLLHTLELARRNERLVGLLFVDLDGFKSINDTLGHGAGDRLLCAVSERLRSVVRSSDTVARAEPTRPDADPTAVSRIGGDEFTVLLSELSQPEGAAVVAERILVALREPFTFDGHELYARASIGISIYPADAGDAESLLRHADRAMYEAKQRGRNDYQFYSDELDRAAQSRVRLEARLRRAVDEGAFELHYQPVRDQRTGRTIAGEALLRWRDAELGDVPPLDFIPVAEQCGLSGRIGRWVFERACLQIVAWRERGYRPLRIAVNLSGQQLRSRGLAAELIAILDRLAVPASLLEVEITESTVMSDDPITRQTLSALNAAGVGIALDDFGTGFSSLSNLRTCPVDRLKIDRSFVTGLPGSASDLAIVKVILSLGQHLGISVVAEGVETEAQLAVLRELGCHEIQGWLVSRAVPADAFVRFLERDEKNA
jgi:predicted signal transduction protein with EAL and GGDEF domain